MYVDALLYAGNVNADFPEIESRSSFAEHFSPVLVPAPLFCNRDLTERRGAFLDGTFNVFNITERRVVLRLGDLVSAARNDDIEHQGGVSEMPYILPHAIAITMQGSTKSFGQLMNLFIRYSVHHNIPPSEFSPI